MQYDVIGIGIPYLDYIVPIGHEDLEHHGVLLGQSGSLEQNICQKLADANGYETRCGGPAANTLSGLAALGLRCGHVGVLGPDEAGDVTRANLNARGIDQLYQPTDEPLKSPVVYAFVTPEGERTLVAFPNDSGKIASTNLPIDLGKMAKIFYLQARFIGRENLIPLFLPILKQARDKGADVMFGLQSFKAADPYASALVDFILETATFVIGNEEECAEFMQVIGTSDWGFTLVKTMGAQGAEFSRNHQTSRFPTAPLASIVDAIGAGDQFTAGFIFGLLQKRPLPDCVALGFRLAQEILSITGGQPAADADWRYLIEA